MSQSRTAVLFVCLGNICRSPLAEGIFLHQLNRRGLAHRFRVDSAGTGGWHVGERPDHRALAVAERRGVHLPSRARQVTPADFVEFDQLVCMDRQNRRDLLKLGAPESRLTLMLAHRDATPLESPELDVPDPYYGDLAGFERVFEMLDEACGHLIERLA